MLDVIAMDEADEDDDEDDDAEELASLLLDVIDEFKFVLFIFIALLLDVAWDLSAAISANLLLLLLLEVVSDKLFLLSFTVIVVPDVIESKFDGVNCVQAFDIVLI